MRVAQMDVSRSDHRAFGRRCRPSFRAPACRRNAISEGAGHHEDEVYQRHDDEGLPDADRGFSLEGIHQQVGKWSADHCAATETHDGHAGCHAAAIREPLDQRRDGRDVAKAKTHAANDASTNPHQPQLMGHNAERCNENTAAPAAGGNEASLAWTDTFQPAAPDGSRAAEQNEEERIDPSKVRHAPVAGGGEESADERQARAARIGRRKGSRQRQPEHAEAIGHADAQMDCQCGWRNQPPVETGFGDNSLSIKKTGPRHASSAYACNCHRQYLPLWNVRTTSNALAHT